MSWGELPPTLLKHKKLWAAVVGVFASVCAATHKPMGNHRAHTTPIPYFTRGQENSQWSGAGTEMMEELENRTHCWLHLTDSCQRPAADGFRGTWISLLPESPSLLLSMDTKTMNENQETCSTSDWALQPHNAVSWSERNTKQDMQTHPQKFIVTHCSAEGWGKPPPLLC